MQLNYPKESNYQICLQPFFPFKVALIKDLCDVNEQSH